MRTLAAIYSLVKTAFFSLLFFFIFFTFPSITFSAANHIVISQIQIEGAVANDEFVELYNPTLSSVDLSSWRLTRKTAGGAQSNLVASLSGVINPQSYFLIAHPEYDGSVAGDLLYSATSSGIASNNTVLLYSDAGITVVDKVGMGTAGEVETSSVANPPDHGSARRISDDDTDNNAADFEILETSDPQNSESTTSPSPTASAEPTATATATASATPSPSATATPTSSPTPTAEPTLTPSPSPTATADPTATATASPTPSNSPKITLMTFNLTSGNLECSIRYIRIQSRFFSFSFPRIICERI